MQYEKIICAGCLSLSAISISISSHQPIAKISSDNGDTKITYSTPYASLGKVSSLISILGAGYFINSALSKTIIVKKEEIKKKKELPIFKEITINTKIEGIEEIEEEEIEEIEEDEEEIALNVEVKTTNFFDTLLNHKKKHTFIPVETGSGKTTMLLGAIDYIYNIKPNSIFLVSTAKAAYFGGLEDIDFEGESCVLTISNSELDSIVLLRDRLKLVNQIMEERQRQRQINESLNIHTKVNSIYIILDEWLRTLGVAANYDKQNGTNIKNELIRYVEDFLCAGREDECILWIFAQDHQVQNAKINTGYWKNFGFVVLGSKGYLTSIRESLYGKNPIISGNSIKNQIWNAVLEKEKTINGKGSFVFSNLISNEVIELPYLPDIKRKQIFKSNNISNVVKFERNDETENIDLWA